VQGSEKIVFVDQGIQYEACAQLQCIGFHFTLQILPPQRSGNTLL